MKVGAGRDRIGAAVSAAGLERLVAGEHVHQHLAGDRGLGGVGLALALGGLAVELVPGLLSRQACWAASTAAQRSVLEPAFDSGPVRELWPDC